MSDLQIEIMEMLAEGKSHRCIANFLDIPLTWIYEAIEMEAA